MSSEISDAAPTADASVQAPGKHRFAMVVGYATLAILAGFVLFFVYGVVAQITGKLPLPGIALPFDRHDGLQTAEVIAAADSPRSFLGDGNTYCIWHLTGSTDDLRNTTDTVVRDGLVWRSSLTQRDHEAIAFVRLWNNFGKAKSLVDEVLASDDCRIAYSSLRLYDRRIYDATLWLFSPRKKLLVYLNANT